MKRSALGGIIRSSVASRYQLGFVLHAGSLILPFSASIPHGTWESAMKAAMSGSTSPANEAENSALSRNRYPSCGGRIGGTGAPRRWISYERRHRLAFVGSECGDINQSGDFRVIAHFDDHRAAYEWPTRLTGRGGGFGAVRVWVPLAICGPMFTQRSPMTRMRNPFRKRFTVSFTAAAAPPSWCFR